MSVHFAADNSDSREEQPPNEQAFRNGSVEVDPLIPFQPQDSPNAERRRRLSHSMMEGMASLEFAAPAQEVSFCVGCEQLWVYENGANVRTSVAGGQSAAPRGRQRIHGLTRQ